MSTDTEDQVVDTASAVDDGDQQETDSRQFVTFTIGDESFAVDMMPVQEIIRMPEVVRVPLAPPALDGLANLRGKVLPIISLRRLFGMPEREADEATRALVVDVGQPVGLVVDRVASVSSVDLDRIEATDAIRSTVNTDMVSGVIKDNGKHGVTMVLDFQTLIAKEFAHLAALTARGTSMTGLALEDASNDDDDALDDERQLVSFEVAGQEYAVDIQDVQEIVQVPDTITHVPRSASHVIGVINLRGRLLPLVDLRCMFALPDRQLDEKSRIVVLSLSGSSVGVGVDSVSEVLRVAKSSMEAMPPLLARDEQLADITEICRLEGGKRLVSIITASNLLDHSSVKEALNNVTELDQDAIDDVMEQAEDLDDDEQVVVFRLDKEEFGVPIESVQEIVRIPDELIRVPKAPGFVEGVINLRGSVLPVIDLRRRLGLPNIDRSDRQRIVVFVLNGVRTGFIVDQVAEVLKLAKLAIEEAPQLSAEQGRLLSRMANLEKQKRMLQLLDPVHLLEGSNLAELASLAAAA